MVENRVGQENREQRAPEQGRSEELQAGLVELPVFYTRAEGRYEPWETGFPRPAVWYSPGRPIPQEPLFP